MIPRLYLITDRKLFADNKAFFNAIEESLDAGIEAVQLREKDLPTRKLLEMAYKLRDITSQYNASLFINDRVDIALCVSATGIHLGQASLPASAVRKIAGKSFLIGVSTHSLNEVIEAEGQGADFITFGPLYQTPSKMSYGMPVGLDALKDVRRRVSMPILGIGGINLDNISDVMATGADGVAMIRGILAEGDISNTVRKYLSILGE